MFTIMREIMFISVLFYVKRITKNTMPKMNYGHSQMRNKGITFAFYIVCEQVFCDTVQLRFHGNL